MSFGANVNIAGEIYPKSIGYVYDPIGMSYVPAQQAAGGGGAGGPVTVADGADVTAGAKADAAWDGSASSVTAQGLRRYMSVKLEAIRALLAGTLTVGGSVTANAGTNLNTSALALDATVAKDGTDITGAAMPAGGVGIRGWLSAIYGKVAASIAVTGTFWQATQPVSIAASVAVTGVFWQTTQPVSVADGSDATQGAVADAAWSGAGSGSVVAILKYVGAKVEAVRALLAGVLTVAVNNFPASFAVSNFPATQPVSLLTAPLPTNAAQETGGNLDTLVARTALGQALASKSVPVIVAQDQQTFDSRSARQMAEASTAYLYDHRQLLVSPRHRERTGQTDLRGYSPRGASR